MAEIQKPDQIDELVQRLSGQTVEIPSLGALLGPWPCGAINPNLDEARRMADAFLESFITDPQELRKNKDCDFGRLACLFCPGAALEELRALTAYLIWAFVWDDIIDLADPEVAGSTTQAALYCEETLDYIKSSLRLQNSGDAVPPLHLPSWTFSQPLRTHYQRKPAKVRTSADPGGGDHLDIANWILHKVQRARVFKEIDFYMSQVLVEHGRQYRRVLPNVEDYTQMRLGSSGMCVFVAFLDHMNKLRLPEEIMNSHEMRVVWIETTKLSMFVNDIYSLKKEIASRAPQNIVPIVFESRQPGNLDQSMKEVATMFQASFEAFESASKALIKRVEGDEDLLRNLSIYMDNCRTLVTGLMEWSKRTQRYGLSQHLRKDGSLTVRL